MKHYIGKPSDYFSHSRRDIISMIPPGLYNNVLEIGAGGGDTLLEIKRLGLAKNIYGIELMAIPNSHQKSNEFSQFIIGNVEQMEIPFSEGFFDLIICGDVLEHLVDPWALVHRINSLLAKNGNLVTSIPNIRIKSAFYKIFLKGDFGYTPDGTFDKTHLRFFCKKNMVDMLNVKGLEIQNIKRNFDFNPNSKGKYFDLITFSLLEEFLALQFLFLLKKR